MGDHSMNGAFKSSYVSGSVSYHQSINEKHKIGLGFQISYANRSIDYSKLTFGEQFTSGGFDVTLPSGETALSNMKPFFSFGSGILFNSKSDNLNYNIGVSLFHINKPRQTFLKDGNEILPMRFNVNSDFEFKLNSKMVLVVNGCLQQQAKPAYVSIGGAIGYDISEYDVHSMLYAGGWFREGDSYYPYLGWSRGVVQIGFTYDITHSKQNQGPSIPRSFEMSLVIRQKRNAEGTIPCPWK
jgi:type IX secretion system PorP/SprF family membrane protein